jgi:hypothetical protein
LTCFTEEEVTEERILWGPRYDEYLELSSSLGNRNHPISKEEKNMRFQELFKKYKQVISVLYLPYIPTAITTRD